MTNRVSEIVQEEGQMRNPKNQSHTHHAWQTWKLWNNYSKFPKLFIWTLKFLNFWIFDEWNLVWIFEMKFEIISKDVAQHHKKYMSLAQSRIFFFTGTISNHVFYHNAHNCHRTFTIAKFIPIFKSKYLYEFGNWCCESNN